MLITSLFPCVPPSILLPRCETKADFGGKFTEVSVRRADRRGDLFSSLCEFNFFAGDGPCFSCTERVGRTGGRTEASPPISAVFFSSYTLSKAVTVTTSLLFGHVTLLCITFLCIKLSEGPL